MHVYTAYCNNLNKTYLVKANTPEDAKIKLMSYLKDWLDKLEAESSETGVDINVSFFTREVMSEVTPVTEL